MILDVVKASHAIIALLIIGIVLIVLKAPSHIELSDSIYRLVKNVAVGTLVAYVILALPRMS